MSDKIEIQFTNTVADYRRVLFRLQKKRLTIIVIAFLFVVLPLLWYVYLSQKAEIFSQQSSSFHLIIGIAAIYLPLYAIYIVYKVNHQAKATESALEPAEFTFSNKGVDSVSQSSSQTASWTAFEKIQEQKDDFLLYPQKNIFQVIPKRAFQNDSQINDFRVLVKEQIGDRAKFIN